MFREVPSQVKCLYVLTNNNQTKQKTKKSRPLSRREVLSIDILKQPNPYSITPTMKCYILFEFTFFASSTVVSQEVRVWNVYGLIHWLPLQLSSLRYHFIRSMLLLKIMINPISNLVPRLWELYYTEEGNGEKSAGEIIMATSSRQWSPTVSPPRAAAHASKNAGNDRTTVRNAAQNELVLL